MRWYFEPRREQQTDDDEEASQGLASFPAPLLQRHGAAVLDPQQAAVVYGWPAPRSTVYRTRTLLVPPELLQDEQVQRAIRSVLGEIGLDLEVPRRADADDGRPGLPVTVVLVPRAPAGEMPARPVVVDAWTALQTLRAAASSPQHAVLSAESVAQIGLEHLLIGSAIAGSPASEGGGVSGSPASEGGGICGPTSTDSYLFGGWDARSPVDLFMDAPPRQSQGRCAERFGRRPVIAVLDTGVREHWWLDVRQDPAAPGGYGTHPDGFVAVDLAMQNLIYANGQQAAAAGDWPRQLIRYPWDRPVTANPLIGELNTDTGHGTFIAGIVRQSIPDAQVLSVRIMHGDGIVYEGDLLYALGLIANRVAAAQNGDMTLMVDLVSLSLGYFSETQADRAYTFALWQAIEPLLDMGVAVIAAAGNFSARRRFYPAAFADLPAKRGVPVISVGALNPNGSKALFSDDGRWVRAWATGALVVSTFPADVDGSREPEVRVPAVVPPGVRVPGERAALDPDDYAGGFALWSGTSFSGPGIAGVVAAELLAGAESGGGLSLADSGADAAVNRIAHALGNLGWAE
jgi:subtilisin family serine protease